jgi:mRNA interferase MazF
MGRYLPGDVVLVAIRLGMQRHPKTRPAVVVRAGNGGELYVCPVSSSEPVDGSCVPLGLPDFARGGLDLFTESYVLTSIVCRVSSSDVIGKKGRMTEESYETVRAMAASAIPPGNRAVR